MISEAINRRSGMWQGHGRIWPAWLGVGSCAQLGSILLLAFCLKSFYSTVSVNQLRWLLAPTASLVELLSGQTFTFESHAGYMSGDHRFLIAASCAGVNFLLAAFLMLGLRLWWRRRNVAAGRSLIAWVEIALAFAVAYATTLLANTARISLALQMQDTQFSTMGLMRNEVHRIEGIVVYFGFLVLLYFVTEGVVGKGSRRQIVFPLLVYYATTLGLPLANSVWQWQAPSVAFWEHMTFVVLIPFAVLTPLLIVGWARSVNKTARTERGYARGSESVP